MHDPSIRVVRVVGLCALLTGGPLFLLAYFSLALGQEVVREEVESTLKSTVVATGAFVEQHMLGLRAVAESYASRPVLRRSTLPQASGARDLVTMQSHLDQLRRTNPGIAAAFVTDLGGKMLAISPATPQIVGQDFSARDWYIGLTARRASYISEVYISRAKGAPRVVGVSTYMPHPDGEAPIAILVIAYQTQSIQAFVEDFFREQAVTMTVTDQRGVPVATPDAKTLVGLERLRSVHVAAALRGETGVDGDTDPQHVIGYTSVPRLEWSVVGAKSNALAYARSRHMRITIMGLASLLGCVLLVALGYLARTLRRRVAIERDLAQARDAAMAASRLKSAFLANMSHEIRTPLNGVIGMTELLMTTKLDKDQSEYATLAKQSGEALLQVINDILDISKIEAGKLEIEAVTFELPTLLKSTAQMFEQQAATKGLTFTLALAETLPMTVQGDPGRLRQVLINLLNNAIKFTSVGSIVLRAQAKAIDAHATLIIISIEDTGIGIENVVQKTLFEPFSQADASTTRRYGGTGLGLAICRQLVDLMHGSLQLESRVGKGSKFTVALPLHHAEPVEAAAKASPDPNPAARFERVLVVDDNSVNLKLVVSLLTKKGYVVDVAHNGQEAVDRVLARTYAAVLMDCHMPVLDGYEATAKIRATVGYADLPIIALTASAMQEDQERCRQAGMNDFVAKPIAAEALYAMLERWGVAQRDGSGQL